MDLYIPLFFYLVSPTKTMTKMRDSSLVA